MHFSPQQEVVKKIVWYWWGLTLEDFFNSSVGLGSVSASQTFSILTKTGCKWDVRLLQNNISGWQIMADSIFAHWNVLHWQNTSHHCRTSGGTYCFSAKSSATCATMCLCLWQLWQLGSALEWEAAAWQNSDCFEIQNATHTPHY